MSRTRRNFSAKFKADLVLEVLKGEKNLNSIATDNSIQPNLSKRLKRAQVVSYKLRNVSIDHPDQAWSIDITYIPSTALH